ncbi:5-methylcytosine-specific restriction endonuclease system specificity protein McrC [Paenibacillus psychroresistens]|uniref:5-methylcytosine-specific restriction endonuclease system specificity protein McrC n=1 Tax=Paenibacillus psychroresistens TaxID=1778678 RepID=A0A6B8RFF8_9BACL|nr:5-methylcytosine-specific restriction endonuclease system specificity protein McrC [Paenibacillus psychroresistens]QGQ94158.1 5-methylcytosine-specific restriction endonuclease system specificity protein McrC [Paenibacillus psychroresistens]
MKEPSRIPIRNLYYMLCYAWDRLDESEQQNADQEDAKDIYDLFTRLLIDRVSSMLKKGLYREYHPIEEESSTLRGKLQFAPSVRALTHLRSKMVISYDELSTNLIHNRIVKSTLHLLLKVKELNVSHKERIAGLYNHFQEVSLIKLNDSVFQQAKVHRNNRHYGFVLQICRLIYHGLLVNEEDGTCRFSDFERDHKKMAELFEQFTRNFYKKELKDYWVHSEKIDWDEDTNTPGSYLPIMRTDISIDKDHVKWIIDTKFYGTTLSTGRFGNKTIRSNNLYQIYSYLRNIEKRNPSKVLKGALLYPKVDQSLSLTYQLSGHEVKIYTVDLSASWPSIHQRLLELVGLSG